MRLLLSGAFLCAAPELTRLLLSCAFLCAAQAAQPADELYPELNNFDPHGNPDAFTGADPLASYTWGASANVTGLQRYEAYATAVLASPTSSVQNAPSLIGGGGNASFLNFGRLRLDFETERAGWFEFFSTDLSAALSGGGCVVKASISEYNEPWPGKTQAVKAYDGGLFRLETNDELYEGVRYAWIMYESTEPSSAPAAPPPWTVSQARVVAQVKPVNYTASFSSSSPTLTAVWAAGALGSRLNMHESYFGSILMDRGDRVSIQGDGHPTMAAALAAFSSPEVHRLVRIMLNATDSGCVGCHVVDDGIMSYPVLWSMSVHDYLWSSGDKAGFLSLFADDVARILDNDARSFLTNPGISLQGWDDRLGNGWCWDAPPTRPCGKEPQLTFAGELVMAIQEFSAALGAAGDSARAAQYASLASNMTQRLLEVFQWGDGTLGVHSSSMFLNVAGLATPPQAATLISAYLNDSTSICSWSPFNSYWILQGLGNAGALDRASAMAELCWGGMTRMAPGCFWELWEPMWEELVEAGGKAPTRPSYCHPWSNGVTAWLSRALGGINPASPGFSGRGYVITPHVSAAYPTLTATASTPAGEPMGVQASHHHQGGVTRTAVHVQAPHTPGVVGIPAEVEGGEWPGPAGAGERGAAAAGAPAAVAAPAGPTGGGCFLQVLLVNGVATAPVALAREELGGALRFRGALPRTHLFTPLLPPGSHAIVGEYNCSHRSVGAPPPPPGAPPPVFPPVAWRALGWDLDASTQGAWLGKRGQDGWHLFAFDTNATGAPQSVASLPPYANSVGIHMSGFTSVSYRALGTNGTDPAFLQDPRGGPSRRLGYASTGGDGSQGIAINVNMTTEGGPSRRRVSFYVSSTQQPTTAVDPYQNGAPSMVLRVMDLVDLNPIAPDVRVSNYEAGVWYSVTICCDCPRAAGAPVPPWCGVRVRFMQIDGTNSVSAVVFDSVAA